MRRLALVCSLLSACTAAQIETDSQAIVVGCQTAMQFAPQALALPTVGPFVAAGVLVGCGSAEGIAKLTSDPTSAQWLAKQTQMLRNALHK